MPSKPKTIEHAFVGGLREDYFITAAGDVHLHKIGGNAVYAAVGARIWGESPGLIARVGHNYPAEWLEQLQQRGLDTAGVTVISDAQDMRTFYAYQSLEERLDTDPAAHFARVGQALPPELADYVSSTEGQDERTRFGPLAVRPSEIPRHFLLARGIHLSPCEFVVHSTLPATLRRSGVQIVTCDPSLRYMQPDFADEVKQIVHRLDAFMPSELEVRSYLPRLGNDLWEAAEAFGAMGARYVVIKLGARGQYVFETASGYKWHVPAYAARVRDVTGAGDAYCGGFIVGLTQTEDPVEAALRGAVSASLVIEGTGALYALDSTPGLAQARLDSLRDAVRRV
jgi:ribokinase